MKRRRRLATAALTFGALALAWSAVLVVPALAAKTRKEIIGSTMPSVAMILAVEKDGKKLKPIASGSGTIIDADGSILTNYHVISNTKTGELYDLFVVARFHAADSEPRLICAGRPSFGKHKPKLDLALIKCDLDMNLRPYKPKAWPTIPIGRSEEIVPGEQILVLGYPNVGGSTIQVTQGLLSGWMSEGQGTSHRAYMKTDAAITHGNSGGTAIDETGHLVGVPTAFRVTTAQQGEVVVTAGKVGLIRPIEHARDLISVARSGWTPGANNDAPDADKPTPAADGGVQVNSKVVDAANGKPVAGAFVVVFRPSVKAAKVDLKNLEAQTLTWGQTNANGVFSLKDRVTRGRAYTVGVIAKGYQPLIADGALTLDKDAPAQLDPWKIIRIKR